LHLFQLLKEQKKERERQNELILFEILNFHALFYFLFCFLQNNYRNQPPAFGMPDSFFYNLPKPLETHAIPKHFPLKMSYCCPKGDSYKIKVDGRFKCIGPPGAGHGREIKIQRHIMLESKILKKKTILPINFKRSKKMFQKKGSIVAMKSKIWGCGHGSNLKHFKPY
jgi:hypothetical protein